MRRFRFTPLFVAALFATPAGAADAPVKVALVGDSTVTDKAGWGLAFDKSFGTGAVVENFAKGGASSRSFRDQRLWEKAIAGKPDWVLIQFGHNDQPGKGPERETDPKTGYRDNLRKFVDEARAAGVKPILVTSPVRRSFDTDGTLRTDLEPYAEVVRVVGEEKKVPVVDLHLRSKELCEKLGAKGCLAYGPPHPTLKDKVDGTHLNEKGAAAMAALVTEELKKAAPDLAKLLK